MERPPLSVLLRGLSLEASWHARRMQGLGFLYALLPVLRRSAEPRAALRRHAGYFNMNVWTASMVLAGVARLELQSRGDDALRLRDTLAAPLSGAGDALLWSGLRPACLAAAVSILLLGHPGWALGLALAAYDLPLVWLGWRGFRRAGSPGGELGLEVLRPIVRWTARLRAVAAALAGGLASWGITSAGRAAPETAFLMGLGLLLGYYGAKRQVSPGVTFLILVALGSMARHAHVPKPGWLP